MVFFISFSLFFLVLELKPKISRVDSIDKILKIKIELTKV